MYPTHTETVVATLPGGEVTSLLVSFTIDGYRSVSVSSAKRADTGEEALDKLDFLERKYIAAVVVSMQDWDENYTEERYRGDN